MRYPNAHRKDRGPLRLGDDHDLTPHVSPVVHRESIFKWTHPLPDLMIRSGRQIRQCLASKRRSSLPQLKPEHAFKLRWLWAEGVPAPKKLNREPKSLSFLAFIAPQIEMQPSCD